MFIDFTEIEKRVAKRFAGKEHLTHNTKLWTREPLKNYPIQAMSSDMYITVLRLEKVLNDQHTQATGEVPEHPKDEPVLHLPPGETTWCKSDGKQHWASDTVKKYFTGK